MVRAVPPVPAPATFPGKAVRMGLTPSVKRQWQRVRGLVPAIARRAWPVPPALVNFAYQSYEIPVDLIELTGGGPDTWHEIAAGHMRQYEQYCPIQPDHHVLEIGCGVGRDAIHIADLLSAGGSYVGIDIIRPSIEWCQSNISVRHQNFRFVHLDIQSALHNADGQLSVKEVTLPVDSASIDRIILQSVFTHMFEADIVHYLQEFGRLLRPGGLVLASFFFLDEDALTLAAETQQPLRFLHSYADGCCINTPTSPEGAVGYTPEALERIMQESGFELDQPIHRGHWSGRQGVTDGQDIVVLRPRT
jgi:SAM-dependent methyltransferase